jgi:dephospho-CoA kinase
LTKHLGPLNPNPLIAIVGMPGSGKSVAVRCFQSEGWEVVHFGQATGDEIRSRGLPVNEANERLIREELRQTHGMAAYAILSAARIRAALATAPTVIDGLYSWAERDYLVESIGSIPYLVAIHSAPSRRYERLASRSVRPLTRAEAESRDLSELRQLEKALPIVLADQVINNDGSIEHFDAQLKRLTSQFL